tara:strand:+ start:1580 stop:2860 length:1281 start_codon:yes stop_codon:yes gene_type:complete
MTVPPEVLGDALSRDGIETLREGRLVIACPRSERQIKALLTRAGRDGLRVVPAGLLSKISGLRPEVMEGDVDLVLSLRNLSKVVDFVPGDGTLTAQAGCIWSDLGRTVRESGLQLPTDMPLPSRTTLGGALASGMSGPDRLRRGPLRHHVLGAHVILSDGTRAKSGGRLVKNVTGFDLHRLYTGSRGTLCVLIEASLRLFPTPEETCALTRPCADAAEAFQLAEDLRRRHVDPLSVTIEGGAREPWRLHVVLVGRQVELPSALARASEVLGDAERLEGADAHNLRAELRDRVCHGGAWAQLRLSGPPARTHLAHAMLARFLGNDPLWRVVAQPGVATLEVFAPTLAAHTVADQIALLNDLRATLTDSGHRLEPIALPGATHLGLAADLAGDPARRWMRNLQRRYDPLGRFTCPSYPGRAPTLGATS